MPKPKKNTRPPRLTRASRKPRNVTQRLIDAIYAVHRRVEKLERREQKRAREIKGFGEGCEAYSGHETDAYRDLYEIADDDFIG